MSEIIGLWLTGFRHYILMCLFLSSPERLPYNPRLIPLTIVSYFVVGLFLIEPGRGFFSISAQILLEIGMLAGIAYLGLHLTQKLPRFQQTWAALIGINVALSLVTIPLYLMGSKDGEVENPVLLAHLLLLIWNLAVLSHIFRRAFEIPIYFSAMVSFIYFIVYQFIVYGFYA